MSEVRLSPDEALRERIMAIPDHAIGGYEWECFSCHYHYRLQLGTECYTCKRLVTPDQLELKFWENGDPASNCSSADLIAREDVLKALGLTPED